MLLHHLDRNGWEHTHPGWYEARITVDHPSDVFDKYEEIIEWLYKRIDKCERHCRWYSTNNLILVKFRYERDYEWFHLTWV